MELQDLSQAEQTLQRPKPAYTPTAQVDNDLAAHDSAPAVRAEHIDQSGTAVFPLRRTVRKDTRLRTTLRHAGLSVQWWRDHIGPELIAQDETGRTIHDPRDFLALERTHLAYVRTSNAFALFGVTLAQLFIFHDAGSAYGRAFATCAYAIAIYLTAVSCVRTIWLQHLLIDGRTATAYYTFAIVGILGIMLLLAIFVVDIFLI